MLSYITRCLKNQKILFIDIINNTIVLYKIKCNISKKSLNNYISLKISFGVVEPP